MILDIPPSTAQIIQAVADRQGISVDELIINAIGYYSQDITLNSTAQNTPLSITALDNIERLLNTPAKKPKALSDILAIGANYA